ncbi:unnamed protein product, partial [Phaeothamnion confervicola]
HPQIGWVRASRTDAGVHAAKNVLAAKLLVDQTKFGRDGASEELRRTINAELPPDLRVFSVCKVPKSFRARRECTWRCYEYYLPWEMLANVDPAVVTADSGDDESGGHSVSDTESTLARFRALLRLYVGTHSFHNFVTVKKARKDRERGREERAAAMAATAAAAAVTGSDAAAVVAGIAIAVGEDLETDDDVEFVDDVEVDGFVDDDDDGG